MLNISHCQAPLQTAAGRSPTLSDLQQAGQAYGAALVALDDLLTRTQRYYKGGDYKDDGCATGRKLHKELVQAWSTATGASKTLARALFPRFWSLQRRRLAQAQKLEGKQLRYWFVTTVLEADRMASVLARQVKPGQPVDAAAMKAAIDRFEAAMDALRAADRATSGLKPVYAGSVLTNADALLVAAKQFRRRRESGESYASSEKWRFDHGYAYQVGGSFSRVMYYKLMLLRMVAISRYR